MNWEMGFQPATARNERRKKEAHQNGTPLRNTLSYYYINHLTLPNFCNPF